MTGEAIRRWRVADLATFTGTPAPTVLRSLVPGMVADGVLGRRGRYWYGTEADVAAWLTGRWERPSAKGPRAARKGEP